MKNLQLENIRRINIFVHVTCYQETIPMSRSAKKPCSIFKTKRSTELKANRFMFKNDFYLIQVKKLKILILVLVFFWRQVKTKNRLASATYEHVIEK